MKAILPTATRYRSVVCLYVRMSSVTEVHTAKAVWRNEMTSGGDTCVVPSSTVLDSGLCPTGKGDFGVGTPQFAAMPPNYFGACYHTFSSMDKAINIVSAPLSVLIND